MEEELEVLYEEIKKRGVMDKDDVINILGWTMSDHNMKKARGYLKKMAEDYEDITLEKEKNKLVIKIKNYEDVIKKREMELFEGELFENELKNMIYDGDYILIYEYNKLINKYNIRNVFEKIYLENKRYGTEVYYVGKVNNNMYLLYDTNTLDKRWDKEPKIFIYSLQGVDFDTFFNDIYNYEYSHRKKCIYLVNDIERLREVIKRERKEQLYKIFNA